ncbi:PDZ domain-containing protein MAGIX [Phyllostomus hastatus]|uniref:PDZ domain-containing protein MAGIX n=1 Tax=Phyllostomus hastatus TaxID=9423 RepID=UPI001E67ED6B|nr:PDZ domain-containing protein MAGIX [Phyllostomus hastatus]
MEPRAGDTTDPRGSRGGRRAPKRASPSARQLLSRLDARPLAARAAADVAALVRRAGATLRLRPKDATNELDSADIEVTDSRLPNPTFMEQRPQHRRSETLGTRTAPSQVIQFKASKPPQASGPFCVELVRGSAGFGLTLSGGRDAGTDTPLAIRGLLKDGPAQCCGRLQPGDLVLHVNGQSTQGLTHAQVVERIRTGGSRLHLVLSRPLDTHHSKPEMGERPRKGDDCSPDPGGPEVMRSPRASASPLLQPQSCTTPKTWGSSEPSPEGAADSHTVPPPELRQGDTDHQSLGSPGPWLVPSQERLSQALGVPGATQLALEMAAGRRRH